MLEFVLLGLLDIFFVFLKAGNRAIVGIVDKDFIGANLILLRRFGRVLFFGRGNKRRQLTMLIGGADAIIKSLEWFCLILFV